MSLRIQKDKVVYTTAEKVHVLDIAGDILAPDGSFTLEKLNGEASGETALAGIKSHGEVLRDLLAHSNENNFL